MDIPHIPHDVLADAHEQARGIIDDLTENPRVSVQTVNGIGVYVDRALLAQGVCATLAERRAAAEEAVDELTFEHVDAEDEAAQLRASQQALASKALGGTIVTHVLPEL